MDFLSFRRRSWKTEVLSLIMLLLSGCASDPQQTALDTSQESAQEGICHNTPEESGSAADLQPAQEASDDAGLSPESGLKSAPLRQRSSSECYHYQPNCSQKTKRIGRCEPQSLPYARCRSGIRSCGLGWNNGPLTWFACEKSHGNTSSVPKAGSALILAAVPRHKMPTGHVAYVEKVEAEDDFHYQIIFSHTNYDRQCSLETNIKASYNSSTKILDIHSGAWKDWGKRLPVAGFILR